jgi:hypothetical protein
MGAAACLSYVNVGTRHQPVREDIHTLMSLKKGEVQICKSTRTCIQHGGCVGAACAGTICNLLGIASLAGV